MRCCDFARVAAGVAALVASSFALAQSYPVKPVRMLVGFSPGGVADVTARLLATKMSEVLGQQVIVENRPGASGAIATERVAQSPPDGYTLLAMTAADTVIPSLRAKLPYNLERDFAAVSLVAIAPFLLVVHPSVPVKNVKDLIAIARSRPGRMSYGSVGTGSTPHLSAEALKMMAKIDIVHVPYKGGLDNVVAVSSGEVDMVFASIPSVLPLIGSSTPKLKAIAVTSAKRASLMPQIPTLNESGLPGYNRSSWVGILAPAAVSREIVTRVNAAIVQSVNAPGMKQAFVKQGLEPQTDTPAEFSAYIQNELQQNAKLIRFIGIAAE